MRSISKLFSAALMLILAAACNTKEIDNPDNPDKPKAYDNIILTAGINQTRVDYKVDNGKLVPGWVEGDVIFGYFGSGDGSQIEFTVDDVKEDGTAVLEPGKGWDDFLQQFKSLGDGEKLLIGLIYTGSEASYSPENPNDVIVSMEKQTGVNIPACMHASNYLVVEQDDTQIIRFLFDNDCAIFEIESLTGIAEEAALAEDDESLALTSLTITNLIPTYEYSYASGALSGKSGTGDLESYTITLPENTWQVDYEGNINRTDAKNLLIAVAPNSVENDILITATAEDGRKFSYLYNGVLVGGKCYIIRKSDVIAKTEDGQYFKTVYDAFEHAEYLNDYDLLQGRTNTVTLLVDEIDGLGEQVEEPAYDKSIKIDYDVTLDLNGFGLSIDGFESFIVQETGDFTITDSRYDGEERVGIWSWTTEEDVPVIKNFGSTSITSAYVFSDNLIVDNEGGVLDVVDSDIHSFFDITINNTGEVKIFDSEITSGEVDYPKQKYYAGDYVINNEGKCSLEISNSNVSFVDGLDDGSQKTAVIYFNNSNTGENNFAYFKMDGGEVSGGTVITGDNVVYSRAEAIQLLGNVKATISGDALVNSDSFNAVTLAPIYADGTEKVVSVPAGELTITGGTITSTDGSAIVNDGELTITDGTITSENNRAVTNYGDLTVSGDDTKITSTNGKAVSNDGKVIINGGTITSVSDSAIGNSGSLTVNAGTVSSAQSSAIYSDGYEIIIGQTGSPIISSPNNYFYEDCYYSNGEKQYCAAIFIEYFDEDNATFTMYGGTVTGDNHAIAMNGPVEAEIKGGILDSKYRTLLVADGASCTISGGQIYCSNNTQPTITCFCTDSDTEGTSLTIECGDSTKKEPLIYSVANITQNGSGGTRYDVPICAICDWAYTVTDTDRHYDNYATVKISGGYLYSATEYYFAQSDEVFSSENVDVSFYSNVNKMSIWDGNISEYSGSGITTTALTGEAIVEINSTYLDKYLYFGYHMTK